MERILTVVVKFGWCLDGNDDKCKVHYRELYEPEKIRECECECHVGKKKPLLPPPHEPPPDPESKVRRKSRRRNPNE